MGYPKRYRRAAVPGRIKSVNPTHGDGRFDADEHAAFLLGVRVPCRSSWVDAARWDEATQTLTLTIGGKDYDFPGIDEGRADEFVAFPSKGQWFWHVWVLQMGRGSPAAAPAPRRWAARAPEF